jgi:hypothetical protein
MRFAFYSSILYAFVFIHTLCAAAAVLDYDHLQHMTL